MKKSPACGVHACLLQHLIARNRSGRDHVAVFVNCDLDNHDAPDSCGTCIGGVIRLRQSDRLPIQDAARDRCAFARGSVVGAGVRILAIGGSLGRSICTSSRSFRIGLSGLSGFCPWKFGPGSISSGSTLVSFFCDATVAGASITLSGRKNELKKRSVRASSFFVLRTTAA